MKTSFIAALAAIITCTTAAPAFDITELESSNLTPEAHLLSKRQFTSDTYNQLTDGTACRPVTVIYARGTNQAGNVGDAAAVGPVFFNNLASKLGGISQLAIQGVTYSASVVGFLQGGDPAGIATMTNLISTASNTVSAASKCPSTKIVLAGYSQGAQLVHSAAQNTTAANAAKVAAVVVFGDPKRGQSFGSIPTAKTLTICHSGDNICEGGIVVTSAHLNYQNDAPAAATFVAGKV
ncbi:carbohydrate esterase family 5 protein [Melanomma pulvis-pyrius CBS 109.77]|uniref:cutinase n=1 Tax=Melanomma pulvis-pyrius CBS 109.77 TaxID=1314802 RepID=A0A6A6WRN7_9PLEO|nr:carbohydrate esterase family 5 protein [Melanomma pulvis-pyrius CBS 109.77]